MKRSTCSTNNCWHFLDFFQDNTAPTSTMCVQLRSVLLQVITTAPLPFKQIQQIQIQQYFIQKQNFLTALWILPPCRLSFLSRLWYPKPPGSCRTWMRLWSLVRISTSTPAGVGWSAMSSQRPAPVTVSLTFWGTSWRLSSKVSWHVSTVIQYKGQGFNLQWSVSCIIRNSMVLASEPEEYHISVAVLMHWLWVSFKLFMSGGAPVAHCVERVPHNIKAWVRIQPRPFAACHPLSLLSHSTVTVW